MSLFGPQLKNRIESDNKAVDSSQRLLGDILSSGNGKSSGVGLSDIDQLRQLEYIMRYFKLEVPEFSREKSNIDDLIDDMVRSTGISNRRVRLSGKWWKNSDEVMLAKVKDEDSYVALFPDTFYGYYYYDGVIEDKRHVKRVDADRFEDEAICFYKPLPTHAISKKEFLKFLIRQIKISDVFLYIMVSIIIALFSTIAPLATNIAMSELVPTKSETQIYIMFIFILIVLIVFLMLRSVNYSLIMRVRFRLDVILGNSVYYRVLNMPKSFFKGKAAGGLSQRISSLFMLPLLISDILCVSTNLICAFFTVLPIFTVAPVLLPSALVPILLIVLLLVISYFQEQKLEMKRLNAAESNGGIVYDLISGVQRLKLSGSEDRAYAKWLRRYADEASASFSVRFPVCIKLQLVRALELSGMIWAFYLAFNHKVSVAGLATFLSAYEIAILNLNMIANRTRRIALFGPVLELGKPIYETAPQFSSEKKVVSSISGGVELSHITFRYDEYSPVILDDISLTIKPGEYVAIVGGSGCGKTTLVRLMLGFLYPEQGTIYYDDMDIRDLDLQSLRKCIGAVLQDGKLFAGDIYSNITITRPNCTMEDAWDAAEKVGMAKDIKSMPMGMHTMISEGNGGISGGQKQRLMIARAIVGNPSLMIMDEATSALDNVNQKIVTDSLDALKCTRIVIAHRLSTIRECDRIIAMDNGNIVESGTYEELIEKGGFFADLVARQQIKGE